MLASLAYRETWAFGVLLTGQGSKMAIGKLSHTSPPNPTCAGLEAVSLGLDAAHIRARIPFLIRSTAGWP